ESELADLARHRDGKPAVLIDRHRAGADLQALGQRDIAGFGDEVDALRRRVVDGKLGDDEVRGRADPEVSGRILNDLPDRSIDDAVIGAEGVDRMAVVAGEAGGEEAEPDVAGAILQDLLDAGRGEPDDAAVGGELREGELGESGARQEEEQGDCDPGAHGAALSRNCAPKYRGKGRCSRQLGAGRALSLSAPRSILTPCGIGGASPSRSSLRSLSGRNALPRPLPRNRPPDS